MKHINVLMCTLALLTSIAAFSSAKDMETNIITKFDAVLHDSLKNISAQMAQDLSIEVAVAQELDAIKRNGMHVFNNELTQSEQEKVINILHEIQKFHVFIMNEYLPALEFLKRQAQERFKAVDAVLAKAITQDNEDMSTLQLNPMVVIEKIQKIDLREFGFEPEFNVYKNFNCKKLTLEQKLDSFITSNDGNSCLHQIIKKLHFIIQLFPLQSVSGHGYKINLGNTQKLLEIAHTIADELLQAINQK